MERHLREMVAAERRRRFVGRTSELALFATALATDRPAFAVLHVHGVGGVGKSALLRMFADQARQAGRSVVLIDGHDVQPNQVSFAAAFDESAAAEPFVVLVNSYELLSPLDDWLRTDFIAGLPAGSLVVLAGRRAPTAGWRDDPGWRGMSRTLSLTNLETEDAVAYLACAGVPAAVRDPVAAATRGHPLALGLVVDVLAQRPDATPEDLLGDPDVVAALTLRLLEQAPDARHRAALATCAIARFTTEVSLRAALQAQDVHEVFGWLRGLSCMEAGARGIYPHDLARDVIEADLRWRDEDLYRQLWHRSRAFSQQRIKASDGADRREHIFDLVFTTRTDPVSRRYWRWESFGTAAPEPATPADRAAILDLVAAHEGPASRRIAAEWWERAPDAFTVYRRGGEVGGMAAWVTLTDAISRDAPSDPVVAAVRAHIARQGGLRPGDEVLLRRFLVDREVYQDPSPAVDLSMIAHFEFVASRPRLAWIVMTVADAQFWAPQFAGINFHKLSDDPLVGDRSIAVFVRDTREPSPVFDPVRAAPVQVTEMLPRPEFDGAVRDAFRDLTRAGALQTNPLLALARVRDLGGGPDALRAVLTEAVEALREHPRDVKQYRAVDRTYLRPAPTQERAAELLGLPFTTYRRHLTQGVARVAQTLWQQEHPLGQEPTG